jgi:hypothetical protein
MHVFITRAKYIIIIHVHVHNIINLKLIAIDMDYCSNSPMSKHAYVNACTCKRPLALRKIMVNTINLKKKKKKKKT